MQPYEVIHGDALAVLSTMPAESVQTCITSPPYFGLRDYGIDGQLGLEPTPDEYVQRLVGVFREVRRVLRSDGTVWLNLGDSYFGTGKGPTHPTGLHAGANGSSWPTRGVYRHPVIKPKDLIGIPWRVAFALQADGWWLRSDIIWHKPNPMPESVRDRPTKAHEYVFLLSKSATYYYDADAIAEPAAQPNGAPKLTAQHKRGVLQSLSSSTLGTNQGKPSRNKRSVWTVSTRAFPGAHFAVFPPQLIEPCVLAGTSEAGCCAACGAPWRRVVERGELTGRRPAPGQPAHLTPQGYLRAGGSRCGDTTVTTRGWEPSCSCDAPAVPCTVLDPFAGAGTTGLVAMQRGRRFVGIELNPEYAVMARERIGAAGVQRRLSMAAD